MKHKIHFFHKLTFYTLVGILLNFPFDLMAQVQPVFSPDGYAASEGTTGGGNATPVTVNSAAEFKSAVGGTNPAYIVVNGMFDLGGNVNIGSNKTVIGASTNSGFYNGTVKIGGTNVILQNLTLGPAEGDVLEVSGATRVFITRCTFHDSSDELCSVVRQADYVTISWCRFYFDDPDSHSFVHLIGNGDDVTADEGKLHVTLHHNWYDYGIRGRIPRVRYGYVHLYNNYFNATETGYAIGTGYKCNIKVENCHFDNTPNLWKDHNGAATGRIGWSNLKVEGGSIPSFMPNTYPVFSLPYQYSLDPVDDVESKVKACAGNVVCNVEDCNGVQNGNAYLDECGECVGGNTGKEACFVDCNSDKNGTATLDQCGVCTGGNTGITACKGVLQGENACEAEGSVDSDNPGFQGSGFLNLTNETGSAATYILYVESALTTSVGIRYANGSSAARPMSVSVNGNTQAQIQGSTTGSWTSWQTENITLSLSAGVNQVILASSTGEGGPNIDLLSLEEDVIAGSCDEDCNGDVGGVASLDLCGICSGGNTGIEPNSTCDQEPYGGVPHPVPGLIQAEDFDTGVNGIAYYETTEENQGGASNRTEGVDIEDCQDEGGGYNLAWTQAGEWVEYTVDVKYTGEYQIDLRVACNGDGRTLSLSMDGINIASDVAVPNTGGWQNWQTISVNDIFLEAGHNVLRLSIGSVDYINLNYMEFKGVITGMDKENVKTINVYPNPFTDVLQIDIQEKAIYRISSSTGQIMESGLCEKSCTIGKELPVGLYFVNLESEGMQKTVKLIKK